MLDIRIVRERTAEIKSALARRNGDYPIDQLLSLDQEYKVALEESESLNRRSNELANAFKTTPKERMEALKSESKEIKKRSVEVEQARRELEQQRDDLLLAIPNAPDVSVPDGKDENENVEIKRWGTIPNIPNAKAHYELGEALGCFDFAAGTKLAHSRFTLLLPNGARLERALMNFMLDRHGKRGYAEVFPPLMVNRQCMTGTGQLPKFEGDFYKLEEEDLYLIPTSEVPVTNLYRDEVLREEDLPIYHTAYTPNFRREAGAAGKDTRGYIRQHQFNKVELVKFCLPEASADEHEKLTLDAEAILEALELPYRRVLLCAGDMGFSARKCYDLEVWFPAQNKYREISSCSNFGDFQARRANLRYKPADGTKARYLHTLNGSGLAIGRTLAAILENYQQADGSVKIPAALHSYLGGLTELLPAKA